MAEFGKTLKDWREEKGWSQEELAQKIGVKSGKQTISRWELGKSEPALSELRKLADLFGRSVGELVDGTSASSTEIKPGYISVSAEEYVDLQRQVIKLLQGADQNNS